MFGSAFEHFKTRNIHSAINPSLYRLRRPDYHEKGSFSYQAAKQTKHLYYGRVFLRKFIQTINKFE